MPPVYDMLMYKGSDVIDALPDTTIRHAAQNIIQTNVGCIRSPHFSGLLATPCRQTRGIKSPFSMKTAMHAILLAPFVLAMPGCTTYYDLYIPQSLRNTPQEALSVISVDLTNVEEDGYSSDRWHIQEIDGHKVRVSRILAMEGSFWTGNGQCTVRFFVSPGEHILKYSSRGRLVNKTTRRWLTRGTRVDARSGPAIVTKAGYATFTDVSWVISEYQRCAITLDANCDYRVEFVGPASPSSATAELRINGKPIANLE